MVLKNKISTVFRQTSYYAFKVWLVDILIFSSIFASFYNSMHIKFWDISKGICFLLLYSLPFLIIFSWLSYKIIVFTKWHHLTKKITLLILSLIIIITTSFVIFGEEDYDGTPIYLIFCVLFSFPILITVGLFFPDGLDEYLKTHKITEGVV